MKRKTGWLAAGVILLLTAAVLCLGLFGQRVLKLYFTARGHGTALVQKESFTESAGHLNNPNRGFYHIHGFVISDEETDYRENLAYRFCRDTETELTLIEVNLREYRDRAVSEQGLANLEALLETLERTDKQLLLRFLYDWDGENEKYEPDTIDVILEHIRQCGPVLKKYKDEIFSIQGLFTGNWGEMNGTKFFSDEDLQALAAELAAASDESTFLAVRTPAQWRKITRIANPGEVVRGDGSTASRLGLYNDGMLGNWSDCGTYGEQTREEHGPFTYWNREQELAFQDALCRLVPMGGEVIVDNSYNDLENAIADMSAMHVTYLNRDYDSNVLNKWAESVVHESGCFDGMDGLTYMERHLGYRLVLRESGLSYDFKSDVLTAEAVLQNVGFAPVYKEADARILLWNGESGQLHSYELQQDVRELPGGTEKEKLLRFRMELPLAGMPPGSYQILFEITDAATGRRILFGNEQEPGEHGYQLGTMELGTAEELWEEWKTGRTIDL